jgi:hypothetical protein
MASLLSGRLKHSHRHDKFCSDSRSDQLGSDKSDKRLAFTPTTGTLVEVKICGLEFSFACYTLSLFLRFHEAFRENCYVSELTNRLFKGLMLLYVHTKIKCQRHRATNCRRRLRINEVSRCFQDQTHIQNELRKHNPTMSQEVMI